MSPFGSAFAPLGIAFLILAIMLVSLINWFHGAPFLFNLPACASGAEVNMMLSQKNVIDKPCPLCLTATATVYFLALGQVCRHLLLRKEKFQMNLKSLGKPLLLFATAMVGFALTFSVVAKDEASASQLNLNMGNKDSRLEVYFFSDWLCPFCAGVEGVMESVYPSLSKKARIVFVDRIIHQEALNFVPYDLSFAVNEKAKYLQLRKALFSVAQKTKNPSYEEIRNAITPLHVTYKQLSFLDVTQQMVEFQKLAEEFKVNTTPTLVIRNAKTSKARTLSGNGQITPEAIMNRVKELE